ncbi:glycosyltransferase family 2 protein [Kamptonema cortianum]|uniref:Glycosyltransferase family 2 protein n=1 Tax=Geitlerinema calcuttense NRMC-F 0142 TaxID=2922238 RepID=A0ABT7LY80_9CYAN|nr:glycosyltransferase family 2 protein [Geitlerinema calcuttense]MDK3158262.1 glycosyltransferase family 2 protein [Kamptonema cortianum]MDL5056522.1 glycosyltransferase family 2 protein [Geitlerinema calcuttense NRMC-F 0142]
MSKPLVSIVINNYNYGRFLNDAIDSALQQTYSPCEVIVVDDGSTDDSRAVIEEYGDRIIPIFKANGGQPSAFNAGFAASRGEILCFLDADDLCLSHRVAEVVSAFETDPSLGWCFHPLEFTESQFVDVKAIREDKPLTASNRQHFDLCASLRRGKLYKNFPYPSTSGLCFRRSLLGKILPMPDAEGTLLNDGYLIFTSMGLSPGATLESKLGLYRLHGDNAHGFVREAGSDRYVVKSDKQQRKAKLLILKAYWIGVNFPELIELASYLMASGIGIFWRNGGLTPEYRQYVKKHRASLSLWGKITLYARAIYVYLKNPKD